MTELFCRRGSPRFDDNIEVVFVVDNEPVDCGGEIFEGQEVKVDSNLESGGFQFLIDVEGAEFLTPNDPGLCEFRMYKARGGRDFDLDDTVLTNIGSEITVYGARASGFQQVQRTRDCTLTVVPIVPTVSPTIEPTGSPVTEGPTTSPTTRPTDAPSPTPTARPTAGPTAFPQNDEEVSSSTTLFVIILYTIDLL